jgi:hypothetical protein
VDWTTSIFTENQCHGVMFQGLGRVCSEASASAYGSCM